MGLTCFTIFQVSKNQTLAVGAEEGGMGMPYELLYGRAGFLWAALFVNKHVGEGTIPSSTTVDFTIYYALCFELELGSFASKSLL